MQPRAVQAIWVRSSALAEKFQAAPGALGIDGEVVYFEGLCQKVVSQHDEPYVMVMQEVYNIDQPLTCVSRAVAHARDPMQHPDREPTN